MPQEIDSLSIGISASSKNAERAIDNLIGRLKALDTAFRGLTGSVSYANNLETAVHALTRVGNAAACIDAAHMDSVAKSLRSLSNAAKSLSSVGDMTSLSNSMRGVSSNAKTMADSIAKSFNIKDKNAIGELTHAIQDMQNNVGKGDAFYDAEANVESIIRSYAKFENQIAEVNDSYRILREYLNDNTIYIPKGASAEQNYNQNRGRIGIRNTTSDPTKGIDISRVQEEIGEMIPSLRNALNPQDIFGQLADYLASVATPAMVDFNESVAQGSDAEQRLASTMAQLQSSMGVIVPTLEQIQSATDAVNFDNFENISDYMVAVDESVRRMRDGLQGASQTMQSVASSFSQVSEQTQPFQNVVNGLESLQGISIGDFSNITVLADGINKLGYQSAITASQTLPQISQGLRSFAGISLPNFENMEAFSQGLRSLGSKAVSNAAYSLPFVADGLKQLQGINMPKADRLNEFAQSLSMFGRKTATTAITNMPKLAKSFQELFASMSKAPKISKNTIDAANAFASLASRAGNVNTALTKVTPRLNTWSTSANKAKSHTLSLASAIGKLYASYWLLFRAFSKIGDAINIASDLTEVRNVVNQSFDDMADKAYAFAETAGDSFGMSKLQSLDAASRYQAMGKTMGITDSQIIKANALLKDKLSDTFELKEVQQAYGDLGNTAADMSINLTKLAGDLASLYNTDIDEAAEKVNSIFTGTTKPMREFGFDLSQATLQEWALTNGLDANVKSMTQAEKAVLRYEYVMANAGFVMGDFVRTSDSWHNSIVRLKLAFQNLGAVIGQGFINLLKPAIQRITAFVNTLTGLVQKAINAIGKLLGWQIEIDPVAPSDESGFGDLEDAMDNTEDASGGTADNMSDAAKSAKKMKDYLLGIDELNVFRPDEDTGSGKGGGGNGGGNGGGSGRGGATGGGVKFQDYESDINSWFGLGRALNKALKDALEGIDWDGIQAKWAAFGHGFASFLNGFNQDATTFYLLGKTIAQGLNTIATGLESFFKWFNGHKAGVDFGYFINGIIENIDWAKFQNAARLMAEDIGEYINGAVGTIKWDKVGKTIAEALNTAITFALTLGNTIKWEQIGRSFARTVNSFFTNFRFADLARTLNAWANGLLDAIIAALKKIKWDKIGTQIGSFLAALDFTKLLAKAVKAIWLAINGLFKAYSSMFDAAPLETALLTVTAVLGGFGSAILRIAQNTQMFTFLSQFTGNLKLLASSMTGEVSTAFGMFNAYMQSGEGFLKALGAGFESISSSLSPMVKVLGSAAVALGEFFAVKDAMSDLITGTGNLAVNIGELVTAVGVASVAFSALLGFPAGLIAAGVTAAIAAFSALGEAVEEEIDTSQWNGIGEAISKPGGTPIEEITRKYDNAFADITESFDNISVKSEGLLTLKENSEKTADSVGLIAYAFENGAAVTDDKIEELTNSFRHLLDDSNKIFNDEYDVILTGLTGGFGDALVEMGYYIPEVIGAMDEVRGTHQKAINDIETQMDDLKESYENGEITQEEYGQKVLELADEYNELVGASDEYEDAINSLHDTIGEVDISSFVTDLGDGVKELDLDSFSTQLDTLENSYKLAGDTITSSTEGMTTALEDYRRSAELTGDTERANLFSNLLDVEAKSAEDARTQLDTDLKDYGDLIQKGMLEKIPGVIEENIANYEKLSPSAQMEISEEEYVQEAMSKYQTNVIEPTTQKLQEFYDRVGLDGEVYANDAAKMIAGGLVDETIYENEFNPAMFEVQKALNDDLDGLIESSVETARNGGAELAENCTDSFGEKMKEADMEEPSKGFLYNLMHSLASVFQSHSPAKVMYPMGNNIMMGIIEGFKEKYSEITGAISSWFTKYVQPWFTLDKWQGLGNNIKTAIVGKFDEFKSQWATRISTWWNQNVKPWFDLGKWKTEADHIRDAIITKFNETVQQWITAITNWWNQNVVPWLELGKWKTEADHIRDAIITKFNEMVTAWKVAISNWWENDVKPWFSLEKWKELAKNIKDAILGALDEVAKEWGAKIQSLVDSFKDIFAKADFGKIGKDAITNLVNGMESSWNSIKSKVEGIADAIKTTLGGIIDKAKEAFSAAQNAQTTSSTSSSSSSSSSSKKKKAEGGIFKGGRWQNVTAYASGGMVDSAQIFMAREAGPELVGTIGSSTAVVNNDQIVASVAAGVQYAVSQALSPYLSDIADNTRITASKDVTFNIGDREIAEANNRGQRALGALLLT